MEKKGKIYRKIHRLLNRIGCPRWLHHFGPKKYELAQHVFVLLLMQVCKGMSLRRAEKLLNSFGFSVPTYSAVCKMRQRMPFSIWEKILQITVGIEHERVAIDGTGFSRTNPSYYFIKRIARKKAIKRYGKLSALFDIKSRKFISLRVRSRPRHDSKDAKYLLKNTSMEKLYADSAYDIEWLHEICFDSGIQTFVKPKKNVRRGFYRKKQRKNYDDKEYHQRSLIEAGFSSLKRKYGGYVSGKNIKSIKTEIYCKAIAHNLSLVDMEIFN